MKRIGIIDFDTSHAPAFVSRLNHVGVAEDQWVEGARVVVGCPGKSLLAPERIPQETAKVRELGLPLVETPEEMLRHDLDAVFIESNSGMQHLERARFFLEHKLPLFIDKPLACSARDAEAIFELAEKAQVPVFSSSSLRYAPEVVAFAKSPAAKRKTLGLCVHGPASLHAMNPGLFNYGIHSVEMLYTILGPGCAELTCVSTANADVATGRWKDGRLGVVRGFRPSAEFGFTAVSDGKATFHPVGTEVIYRELLKAIVGMLESGVPPVPPAESIEIVRFIELALESASNHSQPRLLPAQAGRESSGGRPE